MKAKIFVSIVILSFLASCEFPTTLPDSCFSRVTFRIRGTVTDMFDNSPVKASVDLYSDTTDRITGSAVVIYMAWTDDKGQYSFIYEFSIAGKMDRTERNFYLEVSAPGYKTRYIRYNDENHVRITEGWQIIDVQLEPNLGE